MPFFNLIPRNTYHKNGTQWIGKLFSALIGEKRYDVLRLERRITYAHFWYTKQTILFRFQQQYPQIAQWFSLLNKKDTSAGIPANRQYERYQDFAVYNINHEVIKLLNQGWFQIYFVLAGLAVWTWNWYILAVNYDVRGYL
jgi:hypothetical protein